MRRNIPVSSPNRRLLASLATPSATRIPAARKIRHRATALRQARRIRRPMRSRFFAAAAFAARRPTGKRDDSAMVNAAPACHSCHGLLDPPGLALENFDGLGQYRSAYPERKIDRSFGHDGPTRAATSTFADQTSAHGNTRRRSRSRDLLRQTNLSLHPFAPRDRGRRLRHSSDERRARTESRKPRRCDFGDDANRAVVSLSERCEMTFCDRRRFLLGASGAVLALPMLDFFAPRRAFAQAAAPPKRLLIFAHGHGRIMGNGSVQSGVLQDLWSPGPVTAPLPAGAPRRRSVACAARSDSRRNHHHRRHRQHRPPRHRPFEWKRRWPLFRDAHLSHLPGAERRRLGHGADDRLRRRPPASRQRFDDTVAGFPRGLGQQLDAENITQMFFGAGGSPPALAHINPVAAASQIFANLAPSASASPLGARLFANRARHPRSRERSFSALRAKVSPADQARLDAHAAFIQNLQAAYASGSGPVASAQGCAPPRSERDAGRLGIAHGRAAKPTP